MPGLAVCLCQDWHAERLAVVPCWMVGRDAAGLHVGFKRFGAKLLNDCKVLHEALVLFLLVDVLLRGASRAGLEVQLVPGIRGQGAPREPPGAPALCVLVHGVDVVDLVEGQVPSAVGAVPAHIGAGKAPWGGGRPSSLLRGQQCATHVEHAARLAQVPQVACLVHVVQQQRLDLGRGERGAVAPQQRGSTSDVRGGH
eukprot:365168-Chlamydomonas_euryale.AAC.4